MPLPKKMIGTILTNTLVLTRMAYCVENWDEEPLLCTAICAVGTLLGAKVTYESAKKSYQVVKPFVKTFIKKVVSKNDNLL